MLVLKYDHIEAIVILIWGINITTFKILNYD